MKRARRGPRRIASYTWLDHKRDGTRQRQYPDAPDTFVLIETGCMVAPVYSCGCVGGHLSNEVFYTSVRDDRGRHLALSGPYDSHTSALAALPSDKAWALDYDPRHAPWYAYGTFGAARDATIKIVRPA